MRVWIKQTEWFPVYEPDDRIHATVRNYADIDEKLWKSYLAAKQVFENLCDELHDVIDLKDEDANALFPTTKDEL